MPRLFFFLIAGVALLSAQTTPLAFRPSGAEYSTALDRIVMISANPNQLHIYDAVSGADTKVNLAKAPVALSVSPDGLFAAVAHDLSVSYVNLSTGTVDKVLTTTMSGNQLVVLAAEWILSIPSSERPDGRFVH